MEKRGKVEVSCGKSEGCPEQLDGVIIMGIWPFCKRDVRAS
ncbi:hypothetical protein ACFYU8_14065 [Brevibacillus sp. NPDC003359]